MSLLAIGACSHVQEYLDIVRSEGVSEAYLAQLSRWTRPQIVHSQFETRVHIQATYLCPEFTEFLFYAHTPEKASNNFDRREYIWSVFLINGKGGKVRPAEIRRVDPLTPVVLDLFPYVHAQYGFTYCLKFPASAAALIADPSTKLVFTGVVGTVELAFGSR
jgi:hypothetical protein